MALQLGLDVVRGGGPTRVVASGELDASSAAQVDSVTARLLAEGCVHVVFDLRDLSFSDSAGIFAIARLRDELVSAGGSVQVDSPPRSFRTLARVLNLGFPSAPAALDKGVLAAG